MFQIVFKQTLTMFAFMMAGFFLYRVGKITEEGSKSIANLLIYFIFPIVIIKNYRREFSYNLFMGFLTGFALCFLNILVSVLVSRFIFRKKNPIECFASSFPNSGFFGVPLITSVLGTENVIYSISTSLFVGSMQHSYGVSLITGDRKQFSLKVISTAPNFIGSMIGIVLFCLGIATKFPPIVDSFIDGIAAMNSPIVMIILGSYLAQSDLSTFFKNPKIYQVCLVRLIIIPLICIGVLYFIPVKPIIKLAPLMCIATPCGANVANYCQIHDKNYGYACQLVAMSTLISVITIPAICSIAQFAFGF